jgi:hypothetical protein
MKIYFRKENRKQIIIAETYRGFLYFKFFFNELSKVTDKFKNKDKIYPEIPGEPLAWERVSHKLKRVLLDEHYIDISANPDATESEAHLRLPDPATLLMRTNPEIWEKALTEVDHIINKAPKRFQEFAHWWEYMRRSELYRKDCKALRDSITENIIFASQIVTGEISPCTFLNIAVYTEENASIFKALNHVWDISWPCFYFLWPENMSSENIAALYVACDRKNINKILRTLTGDEKNMPLTSTLYIIESGKDELMFEYPCTEKDALKIAGAFFRLRLTINDFKFMTLEFPLEPDCSGLRFSIPLNMLLKKNNTVETKQINDAIFQAVGHKLETFKTWKIRRRLDPQTLKRELAAFDWKTTLDASLWPELTGESLSAAKSRARRNAKKRIAQLEKAADNRRLTLNPAEPLNA